MCCLQLDTCWDAIGNGSALTCTASASDVLLWKTADIYLADERWTVVVVVAGHNQGGLLSVEYYSSARLEGSRRCQAVGKWFSISEPCTR